MKTNALVVAALALAVAPAVLGEDAYIESDGTQFLVGDYHLQPNAKFELDFQLSVVSNAYRLFGQAGAGKDATNTASPRCELYIGTDSKGVLRFSLNASKLDGTRQAGNFYAADTLRHTIIVDFAASADHFQVWTDGALSYRKTFSAFHDQPSPYPLALFGRNMAKSGAYDVDYKTPMRVYGFKIYDNGTLIRDYFPCRVDGVPGLKDRVTGRFITSESVTPFAYGGDITDEKDDAYISTAINTNSLYQSDNRIAGSSICLDTGYTITPTTRVELDYASLEPNWTADNKYKNAPWFIAAYGTNASNKALNFFYASLGGSDGCCCYRIGTGAQTSAAVLSLKAAHKLRRTVSMNSNSIQVVTAGYTNLAATVSSSKVVTDDLDVNTLTIGARYDKDTRFIPMKVYGLKIYESDELVKDYRPFISNSVPGLVNSLDENDRLYSYTCRGTRTDGNIHATNVVFSAGGDITDSAEEQEAYLQFDGVNGHRIDTDYVITKDSCIDIDFSLWSTTYNGQQMFLEQRGHKEVVADRNGIWARLYINGSYGYSFVLRDYEATYTPTGVNVSNERTQFRLDAQNGKVTVMRGGKILSEKAAGGTRTWTTCTSTLKIGSTWHGSGPSGGSGATCMQLYSFKISEAGVLKRHFVPCTHEGQAGLYDLCEGEFYPLTGGRVCGKGYKGQSEHGTFTVSPQPGKITKGSSPYELSCIAPGASSFEWYEDDKLIEGATTDSYAVQWTNKKPHTRTYKVVPVYNVFNTRVKGDAATAQVELTPVGILISVQ